MSKKRVERGVERKKISQYNPVYGSVQFSESSVNDEYYFEW